MERTEILELLNEVLPDLLKPTVDTLLSDVKNFMQESVSPLVERVEGLSQPKEDSQEKAKKDLDTSDDPLAARVKLLEAQIEEANKAKAEQDKVATDLRFNQSLSQELDKVNPLHKGIVAELLAKRLRAEATEKDGQWLSKDGLKLEETVKNFFETPEGQHFLPSAHVNGVGATETNSKTANKVDLEAALLSAFS